MAIYAARTHTHTHKHKGDMAHAPHRGVWCPKTARIHNPQPPNAPQPTTPTHPTPATPLRLRARVRRRPVRPAAAQRHRRRLPSVMVVVVVRGRVARRRRGRHARGLGRAARPHRRGGRRRLGGQAHVRPARLAAHGVGGERAVAAAAHHHHEVRRHLLLLLLAADAATGGGDVRLGLREEGVLERLAGGDAVRGAVRFEWTV